MRRNGLAAWVWFLALGFLEGGCPAGRGKSHCPDRVCADDENCASCPADCGCVPPETCQSGSCVTAARCQLAASVSTVHLFARTGSRQPVGRSVGVRNLGDRECRVVCSTGGGSWLSADPGTAELRLAAGQEAWVSLLGNPAGLGEGRYQGAVWMTGSCSDPLQETTVEVQVILAVVPESECLNDNLEPNENLAEATPIDVQGTSLTDLAICPGDHDLFRFVIQEDTRIEAALSFLPAQGLIFMALWDGEGRILETDDQNIILVLRPGVYALNVLGFFGDTQPDYSLSLAGTAAPPCTDDAYEPNDTKEQATLLLPGSRLDGLIICGHIYHEFEQDVFRFDLDRPAVVTIDVLFYHQQGDINLSLEDELGREMTGAYSDNDNEWIHYALLPGTYYATLWLESGAGDASNEYTIQLAAEGLAACVDDPFEPDGTFEDATTVDPDITLEGMQLCGPYTDYDILESDFLRFAVDRPASLTAEVAFDYWDVTHGLERRLELRLWDADRRLVADRWSDFAYLENYLFVGRMRAVLGPGTYFLEAGLREGIHIAYRLSLSVGYMPDCVDDALEPNDELNASTVYAGPVEGVWICPLDVDLYAVQGFGLGDEVRAHLSFVHALGDLDLEMVYRDGTSGEVMVLDASKSDSDGEYASGLIQAAVGDTVWVKVQGDLTGGDFVFNRYGLSVDYGPPAPCTAGDDRFEDNDSLSAATQFPVGTLEGLSICPHDEDWYTFVLDFGESVTVHLHHRHADGNLAMVLTGRDALGTFEAGYSDSEGDDEYLSYWALMREQLWLKVFSPHGGQNPGYSLSR